MIDYFAIALTHFLLAVAAWRLIGRDDLDADPAPPATDEGYNRGKPRA
jgi:hypothetical protein